jgi:hypothetical protein
MTGIEDGSPVLRRNCGGQKSQCDLVLTYRYCA